MPVQKSLNMIRTEFVDLFKTDVELNIYRRRTLGHLKKQSGVYIIKENSKIVYIGMSRSCVVEALYRHFYEWNDRRGNDIRITYYDKMQRRKYEAVIILTAQQDEPLLEQSLITIMHPRDNKERYKEIIPMILQQHGYVKEDLEEAPF